MKEQTREAVAAFVTAGIQDKAERAEVLAMLKPRPPVRDRLLTTRAAASLAGCHPKTLFQWERKGFLHPKRITPSRVRWSKSELETFLCETAEA